jgi:hypothetical protein
MSPDRKDHVPGLLQARRTSAPLPAASQDEAAAPLPDHVSHNIEAIRMLHIRADESLSRYHRPIETVSALLGRPAFFYSIVLFVTLWVLINLFAPLWAIAPFDPPPYFWLQGLVGLGALLTTTIVLITPNPPRQAGGTAGTVGFASEPAGRAKNRQTHRLARRTASRSPRGHQPARRRGRGDGTIDGPACHSRRARDLARARARRGRPRASRTT